LLRPFDLAPFQSTVGDQSATLPVDRDASEVTWGMALGHRGHLVVGAVLVHGPGVTLPDAAVA